MRTEPEPVRRNAVTGIILGVFAFAIGIIGNIPNIFGYFSYLDLLEKPIFPAVFAAMVFATAVKVFLKRGAVMLVLFVGSAITLAGVVWFVRWVWLNWHFLARLWS